MYASDDWSQRRLLFLYADDDDGEERGMGDNRKEK